MCLPKRLLPLHFWTPILCWGRYRAWSSFSSSSAGNQVVIVKQAANTATNFCRVWRDGSVQKAYVPITCLEEIKA